MVEKASNYKNEDIGFSDKLIFCATEGCPTAPYCAAIGEYICESKK